MDAALQTATRTVFATLETLGDAFPGDTTKAGRYLPREPALGLSPGANHGWTTSFWTGCLWLARSQAREAAAHLDETLASHVASFTDRVRDDVDLDHHDIGFLYTLACVLATEQAPGTELAATARDTALLAADLLLRRHHPKPGILQAWGSMTDPAQRGRVIIDSLMNLPLLFWASGAPGREHYGQVATTHAARLRDTIIRPDDSSFHTFFFDTETGEPLRGSTAQGAADDSCWARGQAWGIYGFALAARHTGEGSFVDASRRLARYFLTHLPADKVCYWDLAFTDGSPEERDSSAAAIAVCGLLELAELVDAAEAAQWRAQADEILAALSTRYVPDLGASDALLLHGVYSKPDGLGVDEGNLWGDYFYLEALVRREDPSWQPPWRAAFSAR